MFRTGSRTLRTGLAAAFAASMVVSSAAFAVAQPADPVGDVLAQVGSAAAAAETPTGDVGTGGLLADALGTGSTGDDGAAVGGPTGSGAPGGAADVEGGNDDPGTDGGDGTTAGASTGGVGVADTADNEQTGANRADSDYSTAASAAGVIPAAALSSQVSTGVNASAASVGSATLWEGGSAAMSLASSGLLPGSVYTNPSGSLGSGEIGSTILGFDVTISEMTIIGAGAQVLNGYFADLAARQDAGELTEQDVEIWTGVVAGSAEAGQATRDVADMYDILLPSNFQGSIDSVIETANSPVDLRSREEREADETAETGEGTGADTATA